MVFECGKPKIYLAVAAVLLSLLNAAWGGVYGGGSGRAEDPYLIYTAEQLNEIGVNPSDWNKCFRLLADINLSAYMGEQFNIIGVDRANPLRGIFDGNSRTISNFTYDSSTKKYVGLFGCIGTGGAVKNLVLADINVVARGYDRETGGLVGRIDSGSITNCYVTGNIAGSFGDPYTGGVVGVCTNGTTISNCGATVKVTGYCLIGGFVGWNDGGTITGCSVAVSVAGLDGIGGLVGRNSGTIENCYVVGSVTTGGMAGGLIGDNYGGVYGPGTIMNCQAEVNVIGGNRIAGLIGYNEGGTIRFCQARGDVSAIDEWTGYHAGLVGENSSGGYIENCYATGNVTSDASSDQGGVGGLVGKNTDSTVAYSYAIGDVNHIGGGGAYIGGLIGAVEGSTSEIVNCYAIGNVSSNGIAGGLVGRISYGDVLNCYSVGRVINGGGLVGWNDGGNTIASFWDIQTSGQTASAGGTGKTTIVLKTKSFFMNAGWDFETVWSIEEGINYPRLLWQQAQPPGPIPGDVTGDGKVDFADFAIVAEHWLEKI